MSLLSIIRALGRSVGGIAWGCPCCGERVPRGRIEKPLGSIVRDGPTVMKYTCPKCGHKWSVPLRVGP